MSRVFFHDRNKLLFLSSVCVLVLSGCLGKTGLPGEIVSYYNFFTDQDRVKAFISSFGLGAPAVFIAIQILQVIFAPVPGEASGLIGGYLFGAVPGFLYSSAGLAAGSGINFAIGRFLGKRYIRKLLPSAHLQRFDVLLKRQGIIVVFILFLFPGFPKDYLCMFLGLSSIHFKVFIILASVGRMPGTLALSIQGAFLFEQMYVLFAVIAVICLLFAYIAFRNQERLYQWVEKINSQ